MSRRTHALFKRETNGTKIKVFDYDNDFAIAEGVLKFLQEHPEHKEIYVLCMTTAMEESNKELCECPHLGGLRVGLDAGAKLLRLVDSDTKLAYDVKSDL